MEELKKRIEDLEQAVVQLRSLLVNPPSTYFYPPLYTAPLITPQTTEPSKYEVWHRQKDTTHVGLFPSEDGKWYPTGHDFGDGTVMGANGHRTNKALLDTASATRGWNEEVWKDHGGR